MGEEEEEGNGNCTVQGDVYSRGDSGNNVWLRRADSDEEDYFVKILFDVKPLRRELY